MAEFGAFHVLLVDDSHTEAQIFEIALKEASARARLYWVGTGREGIDFLHQRGRFEGVGAVRIVVLDLQLGNESGLEVLREIKSDPKLKRTPVAMLTSSVAQRDIDEAYSLGVNAYLRKPMTLPAYIEALRIFAQHWFDLVQSPSPPGEQAQQD